MVFRVYISLIYLFPLCFLLAEGARSGKTCICQFAFGLFFGDHPRVGKGISFMEHVWMGGKSDWHLNFVSSVILLQCLFISCHCPNGEAHNRTPDRVPLCFTQHIAQAHTIKL
jgi:hypothetical protein